MAKCKYCEADLKWLQPYKAGDRPVELSGNAHNCPKFSGSETKNFSKFEKRIPLIDKDFDFCNMCARHFLTKASHIKYPSLYYTSLEYHKEKYHPNNEILDDIDFMVLSDEQKENIRVKWNKSNRTTKYELVGKMLR